MPDVVFVNLNQSYPQLVIPPPPGPLEGEALRNMTCGWWQMNRIRAAGVRYVLGVYAQQIVSVYENTTPCPRWPELPAGVPGAGRLFIPAYPLETQDARRAALMALRPPPFNAGGVRYGTLTLSAAGEITGYETGLDE